MNSMLAASGGLLVIALIVAALTNRIIWVGLKNKWTSLQCVGISAGVAFSLLVLSGFFSEWFSGQPLLSQWSKEFDQSLNMTLEVYEQLGWKAEELKHAGQIVRIFFKDAFLAWVAMFCTLFSAVSYLIQRRLAPQLPGVGKAILPIELWIMPDRLVWVTMFSLLAIVIGTRWDTFNWLYLIGLSSAVFLAQVYGLIGLGIAFFYINKKKWQPLLKVMVVLVIGLIPMALFFIVFLGLFDTWWDWRKIANSSKHDEKT